MAHFLDSIEGTPTVTEVKALFTPTEEQLTVLNAALTTKQNLQVIAYAGAAKTSTIVMVCNHPKMQEIPTLCLAFNRKIAEEMKARLPSNCTAMTLNSLGHRAWGSHLGMRLVLDTKKNYGILKAQIDKIKNQGQKEELYDSFADLLRLFGHAKSQGWVPDDCPRRNIGIFDDSEFFGSLDEALPATQADLITECMLASIEQSFKGQIDFDDQIYMPTCFHARFPSFPLTIVDEAQDLSALNHQMLELIVEGNRLIAVGDPCQAIYAFRGAYGDSMDRLRDRFNMAVLPLSTSFRCPKAVVRAAQWRAPAMTWPEWAKEGEVRALSDWGVESLPQSAVIICRNNAPLFSIAIRLLIEGRFPQLIGNDIGKSLIKTMQKLGPAEMPQEQALVELESYKIKRLSRTRDHAKGSVEDFCLCLRIFLERGETLGAAKAYAEHLMNVVGPVKLLTIHKSKGLEFPDVFILDKHLLRVDKTGGKNQDQNLLYVAQTRAQERLTYIDSTGFISVEEASLSS